MNPKSGLKAARRKGPLPLRTGGKFDIVGFVSYFSSVSQGQFPTYIPLLKGQRSMDSPREKSGNSFNVPMLGRTTILILSVVLFWIFINGEPDVRSTEFALFGSAIGAVSYFGLVFRAATAAPARTA